jgi:hypothetical protein
MLYHIIMHYLYRFRSACVEYYSRYVCVLSQFCYKRLHCSYFSWLWHPEQARMRKMQWYNLLARIRHITTRFGDVMHIFVYSLYVYKCMSHSQMTNICFANSLKTIMISTIVPIWDNFSDSREVSEYKKQKNKNIISWNLLSLTHIHSQCTSRY